MSRVEYGAHVSCDVLHDVWLEKHVHVDGAYDPAQLALDDLEDAGDHDGVAGDIFPAVCGAALDDGLECGEPFVVYICVLVLIGLFFCGDEE